MAARETQGRNGNRCSKRHDKDYQQAGDVVRHVKMRHHGEYVGVARQRVDSCNNNTSKLMVKLQLLRVYSCTHVYTLRLWNTVQTYCDLENTGKIKISPLVFSIP